MAADHRDVDQVSRPFQIALVAVVLLAGMWFTVLRPKPETASSTATPAAAAPVAPGTKGLSTAVDKAKGAAAASDAANAATQAATGEAPAKPSATRAAKPGATSAAKPSVKPSAAKATPAAKAPAKPAATKATTPADPSTKVLASLAKGKTVVFLFYGNGADDRAARRAVRRATRGDHRVTVASSPITKVGKYEALTSDVQVLTSPTILVVGKNHEAVSLTGYVDARNVTQAIGDVRRAAKRSAAKQ